MILSDVAILAAIKTGKILIEPMDDRLIQTNSVDVRLGRQCWKLKAEDHFRDVYSGDTGVWQIEAPILARELREIAAKKNSSWAGEGIADDAEMILFDPEFFYIATTYEKIGTTANSGLVPEMKSKSTFGRHALTTALCAGLGDQGYCQSWALEVRIAGSGVVPIAVGTPIGQVVFHEMTETSSNYGGKGRYQDGESVRFLPKGLPAPII